MLRRHHRQSPDVVDRAARCPGRRRPRAPGCAAGLRVPLAGHCAPALPREPRTYTHRPLAPHLRPGTHRWLSAGWHPAGRASRRAAPPSCAHRSRGGPGMGAQGRAGSSPAPPAPSAVPPGRGLLKAKQQPERTGVTSGPTGALEQKLSQRLNTAEALVLRAPGKMNSIVLEQVNGNRV